MTVYQRISRGHGSIKEWSAYTDDWGEFNAIYYNGGHYRTQDGKYYDIEHVERETEAKYYTLAMSSK